MLVASADMVLHSWRDGTARDVYADFNTLTLRITLEALFGAQLAAGDERAGREITGEWAGLGWGGREGRNGEAGVVARGTHD